MIQKHHQYLSSFLICFFLLSGQFMHAEDPSKPSGDQVLEQMIERIQTINTITYRLEKKERIKNKILEEALFVKLSISPFRVYSKMDYPKNGLEVLFDSDWEKQKAIINTNSFPWVNVRFSPLGKTMRKDQHHTILDSGYDKIAASIIFQYQSYTSIGIEMTENKGEALIDGRKCWILEFQDPKFGFKNYIIKEGEDLISIANKYKLSDYMILLNNKKIKFYDDVEIGMQIKIPTSYSKRMVLYIDQIELIPLKVEVYDDKGLFEQFEFKNVNLNVAFKANEFSAEFEEYNF